MALLVTGGAGYIGSHTVVELLNEGHDVVVLDNLSNSSRVAIDRIEEITGKKVRFYEGNMLDLGFLDLVFAQENIDGVIHFAGYKAVGESVQKPWHYYQNNIAGTLNLIRMMMERGCKKMIFSSSATVYGEPETVPLTEECAKGIPGSPYGWTKWMIEQILTDLHTADPEWNVVLLRYFNPIGAHKSGRIGEDPKGIPNNLLPYIAKVAVGRLEKLGVFGDDYPTPDGTCIRDYIHVVDLAKGHVRALDLFEKDPAVSVYNLGTGRGYSVLEVVRAFEKACGHPIPYEIQPRRAGDYPSYYADCTKAAVELGWKAELDIDEMCADTWNWQKNNPDGYED